MPSPHKSHKKGHKKKKSNSNTFFKPARIEININVNKSGSESEEETEIKSKSPSSDKQPKRQIATTRIKHHKEIDTDVQIDNCCPRCTIT